MSIIWCLFVSKQGFLGQNDLQCGPDFMQIVKVQQSRVFILQNCAKTLKAVSGFQSDCKRHDGCLLRVLPACNKSSFLPLNTEQRDIYHYAMSFNWPVNWSSLNISARKNAPSHGQIRTDPDIHASICSFLGNKAETEQMPVPPEPN